MTFSRHSLPLTFAALALFATGCGNDTASIEVRVVSDLVPYFEVGTATAVLFDGVATASAGAGLGSAERALADGEPLERRPEAVVRTCVAKRPELDGFLLAKRHVRRDHVRSCVLTKRRRGLSVGLTERAAERFVGFVARIEGDLRHGALGVPELPRRTSQADGAYVFREA